MKQALRVCAPHKVVFDSPCKTLSEIEFALRHGVTINADSYAEVKKIDTALKTLAKQRIHSTSSIGLRVNPMVGAGAIAALSTATGTSKFGVPSSYADQEAHSVLQEGVTDLREQVIQTYLQYPFLTGIMCHVGSQGMAVELMVQGAQHILQLADEIDVRLAASKMDRRITYVDIGGGLSANYSSDEVEYTFAEYATKLAAACGDSLRRAPHRRIVTEFGKAIIAKSGVIAARVEEAAEQEALRSSVALSDTVLTKKNITAVVHAGADLLLRTAYCPDKFPHRIVLLDAHKQLLQATTDSTHTDKSDVWSLSPSSVRPLANVTIAGPLCFSGDVLGRNLPLPEPRAGDICLLLDAGANTLSLFSRHCSRLSPAVFVFRQVAVQVPDVGTGQLRVADSPAVAGGIESGDVYLVSCIREGEGEAELLSFWG